MKSRTIDETMLDSSQMARNLETEFETLLEMNEALKVDLERERLNSVELARERNELRALIARAQSNCSANVQFQTQVTVLNNERNRQNARFKECGQQLAEATLQIVKLERLVERIRGERDDAFEVMETVEAQFERAMAKVNDLNERLMNTTEERSKLHCLLKETEHQLKIAEEERDDWKNKAEESNLTLAWFPEEYQLFNDRRR